MSALAAVSMRMSLQSNLVPVRASSVAQEMQWSPRLVARKAATWQMLLTHLCKVHSMLLQLWIWLAFPSSCAEREWADHQVCLATDVCVAFLGLDVEWDLV